VRANLGGTVVDAHCPNPGRLLEILLPGTTLLLHRRRGGDESGTRLEYSLVAARNQGLIVPLASARANDLAEAVVLPNLFPEARRIHREINVGRSRLDFLVDTGGQPGSGKLILEVKGCTLAAEGTAMFPDAPTLRGLRHLEELEALAEQGRPAGILFAVLNPLARRFVPNLHTDPAFALKLILLKGKIWMRAVSIRTGEDGTAVLANPDIPLDLAAAEAALEDRGVYLLIVELPRGCTLTPGSLGEIRLRPGWYVYTGSGRKNLSARIARHHRSRKMLHWHIDYLLACGGRGGLTSLPVRTLKDLECPLARAVAALAAGSTPGFGCSDCDCPSHLFRFDNNPLHDGGFLDLLLHYRHTLALERSS
jgi:sugar fermentation stimulation protein A